MKIFHTRSKGRRILKSRFIGVSVEQRWWDCNSRRFIELHEITGEVSSLAPCQSVKAYRRMIKRNPSMKGKSRLVSRFVGYDVLF